MENLPLALGTAQLGMPYGIANTAGPPDQALANEIVAECWQQGVRYFDTAPGYGKSEAVLGAALQELGAGSGARVITKLGPEPPGDAEAIRRAVEASADRLGCDRIWGLLLHRESMLDDWNGATGDALRSLRADGLVAHIGVSLYDVGRAMEAFELPDLDLVQLPANVFDRRAFRLGVFGAAERCGATVFVRSVYLQGLALMSPASVPAEIPSAGPAVDAFDAFCREHELDRARFAVRYVRGRAPSAIPVIGAETPAQATENCRACASPELAPSILDAWDQTWPDDVPGLIDPSTWPESQ